MTRQVLAGDIGGTNARLAIVTVSGPAEARVVHEARYQSSTAPGLAPLVIRYLAEAGARPDVACFGIACPVIDGDCEAPNLPWKVNVRALAREIGVPRTTIINDFHAVGYGLRSLSDEEVDVEGGHADFSPTNALERDLLAFLAEQFGRVSSERVLSGAGIAHIYRFLKSAGVAEEQAAVRDEMAGNDPAQVITRHGLAGTDLLSIKTLEVFARAYGTAAGNLALSVLATGGVYIAGGIAPKIIRRLASGAFMEAFRNKGRLSSMVARIPVRVILTEDVALYGAAAVAARTLMD